MAFRRGLCLVSHKYRFVYFPIAKNASSSLKAEFRKPRYETEEIRTCSLDQEIFRDYFTFTFLRDPLSRVASAYQEISLRFEMSDSKIPGMDFCKMEDTNERFLAFLKQVRAEAWDPHVRPQLDFVGGLEFDFWGRIESLQHGLGQGYSTSLAWVPAPCCLNAAHVPSARKNTATTATSSILNTSRRAQFHSFGKSTGRISG